MPVVYTDSCNVTVSPSTIRVGEEADITVQITGITDGNGEIVPDEVPIRVDGATNGLLAIDSIPDRFLTKDGNIIGGARCHVYGIKEGAIIGGIYSTPTNWYYATDKLKAIGAWSVSVVR